MEDCNDNRKRARDESDYSPDSETRLVGTPDSKIRRVDSESVVDSSESQLTRVNSVESCPDSVFDSDVQLQDDILNMLDEADNLPERDSVQGLDSVIKSFEEEILAQSSDSGLGDMLPVTDSGELQPSLGYLFEASDDELGLPPTVAHGEEQGRVDPEGLDLSRIPVFEDDVPGYDGFGFGTGFLPECDGGVGFVTVDGLFDYAEPTTGGLWRSESLQAM